MPRAIIFANGELNPPLPINFQADDWIIAANGGALHCQELGCIPHYVIGDFDSLTSLELTGLKNKRSQMLRYPAHKDETDLELALLHAVHLGVDEVIVYGGLGARWDMTLANLMLLAHPALRSTRFRFVDGNQEVTLICGNASLTIHGKTGDLISLIPLSAEATGITTESLEYPLNAGSLSLGSPRGVSNVMLADNCLVTVDTGLLVVTHIRFTE